MASTSAAMPRFSVSSRADAAFGSAGGVWPATSAPEIARIATNATALVIADIASCSEHARSMLGACSEHVSAGETDVDLAIDEAPLRRVAQGPDELLERS